MGENYRADLAGDRSKQSNIKLKKMLDNMVEDGASSKNPNDINLMYQP